MKEMPLRELRATDLRCHAEGCGAGPGELCRGSGEPVSVLSNEYPIHVSRARERTALAVDGWQWREVDPTDKGLR